MFDLDARWHLHPQVAVRPEPFGALLYHFGTRKLVFLKNITLVEALRALPANASARSALATVGVPESDQYVNALAALADSQILVSE